MELLKTDIESKDNILQKSHKTDGSKTTPSKNYDKNKENNDISFNIIDKASGSNEAKIETELNQSVEIERGQITPPKRRSNSQNLDELVCEASFCENDGSIDKNPNFKAKNSKEFEIELFFG